jgi:type IV pilus assembly protein PilO
MAVDLDAYFDKISRLKMLHRVLIFAGTLVLLIGLYIWVVYVPKTSQIATTKSKLDRLETEIRRARLRARDLKKLETDHAKAQEELRFALRLLPTTSEIPTLLKSITQLGNDSNLEFLLFSPKKQNPKEFYVEIPVSIEVRGSYHNVATFFDKVGKLDRIVNVVNVVMTPLKEQSTTLKTSCEAVTYRFKEKEKTEDVGKKRK